MNEKIASRLFQRTALSKQPDQLIAKELQALRQGQPIAPALVLHDPYILDFLQLPAQFSEVESLQVMRNEQLRLAEQIEDVLQKITGVLVLLNDQRDKG